MRRKTDDYRDQDIDIALKSLGSSLEAGLSPDEAARRLAEFGPNEIAEREEPLWHRVLRRFWGSIPGMIEVAPPCSRHWYRSGTTSPSSW